MRYILSQHRVRPDSWAYLEEPHAEGEPLIVSLEALRRERERWWNWRGRLGALLAPADRVEELAADLPRLDLVAVRFPLPGEGRGFTQLRLLRERYEFSGELRACGPGATAEIALLLARCGADAFELAVPEAAASFLAALARYEVAYQPGAPAVALRRQRFRPPANAAAD